MTYFGNGIAITSCAGQIIEYVIKIPFSENVNDETSSCKALAWILYFGVRYYHLVMLFDVILQGKQQAS